MLSISTIVAALALETDNDPIMGRALQLARTHNARLLFVHVIEEPHLRESRLPGPVDVTSIRAMQKQDAVERIKRLTGSSQPSIVADIVVDAGKPFQIIDEVAERNGADLIVIGPGNAKSLREKVFGSTADRVVRSSTRPVLVVKSAAFDPYQRIVGATDFSAASTAAIQAAILLAPSALVEFVHVIEIPLGFELAMLKAGTSQAEIDRYRRAKASDARKQMRVAFAEIDSSNSRPRLTIIQGSATHVLVRLARSGRTDLIAAGTHGRGAISQALLGSVASRLLQMAKCDVLVGSG